MAGDSEQKGASSVISDTYFFSGTQSVKNFPVLFTDTIVVSSCQNSLFSCVNHEIHAPCTYLGNGDGIFPLLRFPL
jgi:hypothetical protein